LQISPLWLFEAPREDESGSSTQMLLRRGFFSAELFSNLPSSSEIFFMTLEDTVSRGKFCFVLFGDRVLLQTLSDLELYVAQARLKLKILLPLPPKCWDY
jgi:hypothetical protein